MTIYNLHSSVVGAHHSGAHILPPDGKNECDEDAEIFEFDVSLNGARALNEAEIALLQRCRVQLMQKPEKPLHCAGIQGNLMVVSVELADLIEQLCPAQHQIIRLSNVWFKRAKEPSPGRYAAVLVMAYTRTVDLDRSNIYRTYLPHLEKTAVVFTGSTLKTRVVFAAAEMGKTLWADDVTGALFCSEQFKEVVEAMPGLSGYDFGPCTEV